MSPVQDTLRETPAAALIAEGRCSAQCLVAADTAPDGSCRCRCGGTFHGCLGDALVSAPALQPTWYEGRHGYAVTRHILDSTGTARFNRHYRKAKSGGCPYVGIQKRGRTWTVKADPLTAEPWPIAASTTEMVRALSVLLIRRGHARRAGPPPGTPWFIDGLRTEQEARVIACVFEECLYDNTAGARRLAHGLHRDESGYSCSCPDCDRR